MVREYMRVYGAIDPVSGDDCFIIAPKCNTECMNAFLDILSKTFCHDYILLCADNAGWHKSKGLNVPENIRLCYIPPRTPEMNPIEQIWKEVRKRGFKNKMFKTLDQVVDKLCDTLNSLSKQTIISITARNWIRRCFNLE
jgi:putative transposase